MSFYFISFHDKEIAKARQISGELCESCNFLSIRADFTQRCIQTNSNTSTPSCESSATRFSPYPGTVVYFQYI